MGDFLTEKRVEIDTRLKELKPLVEEYARLEAASAALAGVNGGVTPTEKPAKPARPRAAKAKTGKRGRPKGSGQRADECLAHVRAKPGITIPEIAELLGIKQNYLYRVLPGLAEDGLVVKRGTGWHPTEGAAATA
jgi:hypothetical protein